MERLRKLRHSRYIKSASVLATGSGVSQAIAIICSLITTRLYAPKEFAEFTYIISIVNTFQAIVNAHYNVAIIYEDDEASVFPLVKLSILIGLAVTTLVSAGSFLYFYFNSNLSAFIKFTPVIFLNLLAYTFIQVATFYNNRMREYGVMSSVMVLRSAIQNIGAVLLGLLPLGSWGMMLPFVGGQFAGLSKQSITLRQHMKEILAASREDMRKAAIKHYRQPLYSMPSGFLNGFSLSSVTFFVESLFGLAELGFYSISVRILGLPLNIISQNIGAVLRKDASVEYNKTGAFRNAHRKTMLLLGALSVPILLSMLLLGPWASGLVFGKGWERAGVYLQLLAPMYTFRFIGTAISGVFSICGKQRYLLIINVFLLAASVVSFLLARVFSLGVQEFLLLITLTKSLVYIGMIASASMLSRGPKQRMGCE